MLRHHFFIAWVSWRAILSWFWHSLAFSSFFFSFSLLLRSAFSFPATNTRSFSSAIFNCHFLSLQQILSTHFLCTRLPSWFVKQFPHTPQFFRKHGAHFQQQPILQKREKKGYTIRSKFKKKLFDSYISCKLVQGGQIWCSNQSLIIDREHSAVLGVYEDGQLLRNGTAEVDVELNNTPPDGWDGCKEIKNKVNYKIFFP